MGESAIRERREPSAPEERPDGEAGDRPDDGGRRDSQPGDRGDRDQPGDRHDSPADDQKEQEKPKGPPLYKRPIFWIIFTIVVVAGGLALLLWWLHARQHETTDDAFIAANTVSISPQVAGHVLDRYVDDNQWVKAGELLVKIDPRDFEAQLQQALADEQTAKSQLEQARNQVVVQQAQVAQAKADVVASEASSRQAQSDLERYQNVQAGAVSQQQLDAARANSRTTAANLDAARQKQLAAEAQVSYAQSQVRTSEAQLKRSEAAVSLARIQLSYTNLTAPIDGQVTNRSVEKGQYIQIGQALMALVPRDVYVIANYKETQLTHMQPNQPVVIRVDAFPGRHYGGHVQSIQGGSGAAFSLLPPENATGNYVKVVQRVPVKITFDSIPEERLSPGMSVEPDVKVR